jgi:hypothetical protein
VDDEQGPWWTRPPEPGPQAPPVQRRRNPDPGDLDLDEPDAGSTTGPPPEPPTIVRPQSEYPRPRLIQPPAEPEPDPTPQPPPPPARPVVRRVAVVPPTPPPPVRPAGRDALDDRTETLPPVSDDIFATFSGPLPVGSPGSATDPEDIGQHPTARRRWTGDHLDDPDEEGPSGLGRLRLPEPRVLLLAAAAFLVGVLIVVVALVSGRGAKTDPTAEATAGQPSPAAGAITLTGRNPDGLKQVSAEDAAVQLRKAGAAPGGSIVEAWGWSDRNGRNLVVTSIAAAGTNRRTLRVTHVAGLDGDPRTLRVMRDPNLPTDCRGAGTAGFTPKALIVRDLDSNNVAEVIVGWSSRCGSPENKSQIRLALITDGEKYILRGRGVIGRAGTFVPAPRAARWPDGYLKTVAAQYRALYG